MFRVLWLLVLVVVLGAGAAYAGDQDLSAIEQRVISGELGRDLTEIARKTGKLELRRVYRVKVSGKTYIVYDFPSYKGQVTFIDDGGKLAPLAISFGGFAHSFYVKGNVLYYKYDVGSGVTRTYAKTYSFKSLESPRFWGWLLGRSVK